MRRPSRLGRLTLVAAGALLLAGAGVAHASGSCEAGRYKAAGGYAACEDKALAKFFDGGVYKFQGTISKCRIKYAATWDKLEAKAMGSGTTCDAPRFVDNGNGTVTDNLTALQWEKKTSLDSTLNAADPHDADNTYTWSAAGTAVDGTAYTDFLANLPAPHGGSEQVAVVEARVPTASTGARRAIRLIPLSPFPTPSRARGSRREVQSR
jgi:hypothetical protein